MTEQKRKALAEILWQHVEHDRKIKAMEAAVKGLDLDCLQIDLLFPVLDFLGYPHSSKSDAAVVKFTETTFNDISDVENYVKWLEENILRITAELN